MPIKTPSRHVQEEKMKTRADRLDSTSPELTVSHDATLTAMAHCSFVCCVVRNKDNPAKLPVQFELYRLRFAARRKTQ
jgi:hypothetical protein